MAPKFNLIYFNARGRAELARYIFAQAGVDFTDTRIETADWPKHKPKMPFGQLPVLEIDGKQLAQSYAIARYLARLYGLLPTDPYEEALSDMIVNACLDVVNTLSPWMKETNPDKKKELGLKFVTENLPPYLDYLEKFIKEHGKGFMIGDKLTWADLAVAGALHTLIEKHPTALDKYAAIKALHEKVAGQPNIKAWIAKRPVTEH